jgi:acylglycerol lipase
MENPMNVKEYYHKFKDGRNIYFRHWPSDSLNNGIIAIVHGLGEHCGRYDNFAKFFVKHNYSVIGMDLFGHGKTDGKRGHTHLFEDYLDQIDLMLIEAQKLNNKIILYGHSMGGNLVLNYIIKRPNPTFDICIATAPAIQPATAIDYSKIILGKIGKLIFPSLTQPNGLNLNYLSRDPEVKKAYIEDALVHNMVSAEVGMGILNWGKWLEEQNLSVAKPLLIMHGTEDQITSFSASESFARKLKNEVLFKEWEGLYHEIHNETNQTEVFEFTLKWINSYCEETIK